jgi:RNA polymerase sigma-70 factor, ECF subfamily
MNIVKRLEEGSGSDSPLQLQQLIRRTSRGDKTAFAMLYAQTAAKLFGVAVRIVGQKQEAEEVLQESFVAIWQRAGDYDTARGSATGWLTTIVRHCAIDHVRRRASRPESRRDPYEVLLNLAASGSTDRGAELSALQRCLAELDEQPRRAILLAYLFGFTREEIAADFVVPLGTVKSWIRRSLERLKRCLDP